MNCLEFRRQLLADPHRPSPDAAGHRAECPGCAEFAARIAEMERELDAAARVPVPDGLADRILLSHRLGRPARRTWLALAASLVLAVGIAFLAPSLVGSDDLARAAIAHVLDDEDHEFATAKPTDLALRTRVLGRLGIALPGSLGQVRYEGACPFSGGTAYHLVVDTAYGKATLLLMPGNPLASRMVTSTRGLSAVAAPAGQGSIAVIASSRSAANNIERLLLRQAL
ncbi:MAG: DUF3379 family protein [Betaproteobacteria bacterium]|nr:DUF3379 family protein [Betaproteobacteria bacterium]